MVTRIHRLLGAKHYFCVIGLFLFSLVAMTGTIGCSDSGGSSGKFDYHLKGYDGVDNDASSQTQTLVSGVGNDSLSFYAEFPWYVNLTYQVLDVDSWGVSGLQTTDFSVMEDGSEVSKIESEMNIRNRIKLPPEFTYALKTVLILDNSPSEPNPLDKMIESAQVVVDWIDENHQQEIAIVAYDDAGDPILVQDFTDDLTDLNTSLINIKPSYGVSNFYGAVRFSLSLYEENQSPAGPDFVQGFVVAVSDGLETSNLYNVNDAIALRKDKQVITVAVGDSIPQSTLDDLQRLGNGGFYPVPKPDQAADENAGKKPEDENLCEWMKVIQERMIAYADAFYWLQYRSSLTSNAANDIHTVSLALNDNRNEDVDARISGTFSSENFFSGETSIYFNASASDPNGLYDEDTGTTEKTIMLERGQGAGEVAETISALTYQQTGASPSQYEWTSGDTSIIAVEANAQDSSKATVTVVGPGDAVLTVTDTVNDATQTLTIKVKVREESFEMRKHIVTSKAPWFVDMTFQVRNTESENNQWNWIDDLAREDMTVMENNEKIEMEDSETHLRKRDNIPSSYSYTLKTVLHIDNSPSVTANLDLTKDAARAFVKRALINDPLDNTDLGPLLDANDETMQQEIAVVSYNEDGETILVQDFTTDLDTLNTAIDSIVRGYGPIDFYGGMLDSLRLWTTDNSPYDAGDDFVQGVVVVLSDGWQSNQGFYDRQAVLDETETGSKQIICVSVGNDLVSGNSDDLVAFGNAGFYSVPAPGDIIKTITISDKKTPTPDWPKQYNVTYTQLEKTMMDIQHEIYAYANSFYWLDYKSKLDPAPVCDRDESIVVSINNNSNITAGNKIYGMFESCNFFEGIDGMIYVNQTVTNPDGLTGDIDLQYVMLGDIPVTDPVYQLEAFTYDNDGIKNTPAYEWLVSNSNIVQIIPEDGSYANSLAVLSLPENKRAGTTFLDIIDTGNNGVFRHFNVNVEEVRVSPIAYYPFNGNADDATGNGYDGEVFGATLTIDRWGVENSAYAFNGVDKTGNYIAIENLFYGSDSGAIEETVNEISVSAWIKNSSKAANNLNIYGTIISFDPGQYWQLHINDGNVAWFASTSSVKYNPLYSMNKYDDDQWHHICATYDFGGTNKKKIYVDGELVAEINIQNDGPIGSGITSYGFIGAAATLTDASGRYSKGYFKGSIDEVMIFNQVLSDEIIKLLGEY